MKAIRFWFASLALVILTQACAIGSPSMKSPSNESRENIPLYTNLNEISLDEEDRRMFVTDVLGYEYLLYASTTNISWSEDTGDEVREQLDRKLPDEKWRIETDWVNIGYDQLLVSEWKKGDLGLLIVVYDNLSSEDINSLNKKYGIADLAPGSTLVLSHAVDKTQTLPNTTATAQVENQNATATAEFASIFASATADSIKNSIQATQSAKATAEAIVTLQSQLEVLSEDFDSGQLSDKWTIYRPDPTKWNLTSEPGFLQIVGSRQREAGILNIFGIRVTYSDVEAIARIESRNMLDDGQSAWIAFTPEDYSNIGHTVQLGVAFDDREGYQIYMWQCQYANCNFFLDEIGEENITYEGAIYLKLVRVGKNYIGYYSYDGSSWVFVGEKKDFPVITDQITIGAGCARCTEDFDAYFDFIHFGAPIP